MLDATLLLLQQSHKQLSKMLIEHTSRSIEDKPETGECVGALRRLAGCFNQQNLLGWPTQNVSQQSSNQLSSQLKVNPRKVNAVQKKVNAGQRQESQRSSNFGQLFDLDFCANEYDLQKSNSPQNFSSNEPCVDQSQRWSNLPKNRNCKKFAAVNFVL